MMKLKLDTIKALAKSQGIPPEEIEEALSGLMAIGVMEFDPATEGYSVTAEWDAKGDVDLDRAREEALTLYDEYKIQPKQ
jgi:hypothetical protein